MIGSDTDEIIQEPFHSLLQTYGIGLEQYMKVTNLTFGCISEMHYQFSKIRFDCGGFYIDCPEWIKSKTINNK